MKAEKLWPRINTPHVTEKRHARLSELLTWQRHNRHLTVWKSRILIMRLTREEVEYVASLARLGLEPDEITSLQDQLSSILDHIAALDALDTEAIPPTAQVVTLSNVLREDKATQSLPREAVLANAPRSFEGFFEVHAVLGASDVNNG